eukprot:2994890-Prorocentrum_lima.AAC.1
MKLTNSALPGTSGILKNIEKNKMPHPSSERQYSSAGPMTTPSYSTLPVSYTHLTLPTICSV